MASRRTQIVIALLAAVVSGGVLFGTAAPSSLVDAPINAESQKQGGEFDTLVTPELTRFYDSPLPPGAKIGQLVAAEPVDGVPAGVKAYRIIHVSTDLQGRKIPVSGLYAAPAGP
ncbi:hypothetical protein [Gordonia sp. (in: high G+C Gram-positive bacteria)]|uniref:hypothetical protein n=1 Tax=Gordonia sp. (in: high G+C Gram-positive bacteria) TaxID=84139 RepID=UPI003528C58C